MVMSNKEELKDRGEGVEFLHNVRRSGLVVGMGRDRWLGGVKVLDWVRENGERERERLINSYG